MVGCVQQQPISSARGAPRQRTLVVVVGLGLQPDLRATHHTPPPKTNLNASSSSSLIARLEIQQHAPGSILFTTPRALPFPTHRSHPPKPKELKIATALSARRRRAWHGCGLEQIKQIAAAECVPSRCRLLADAGAPVVTRISAKPLLHRPSILGWHSIQIYPPKKAAAPGRRCLRGRRRACLEIAAAAACPSILLFAPDSLDLDRVEPPLPFGLWRDQIYHHKAMYLITPGAIHRLTNWPDQPPIPI